MEVFINNQEQTIDAKIHDQYKSAMEHLIRFTKQWADELMTKEALPKSTSNYKLDMHIPL